MRVKLYEDFNSDDELDQLKDIWIELDSFDITNLKVFKTHLVFVTFKIQSQSLELAKEIEKKIKFTESILDLKLQNITLRGIVNPQERISDLIYTSSVDIVPHQSWGSWGSWKWIFKTPQGSSLYDDNLLYPYLRKDITYTIRFNDIL